MQDKNDDRELFLKLQNLTDKAMSCVNDEDMEGLTSVLRQNDEVIGEIASAHRERNESELAWVRGIVESVLEKQKVAQEALEGYVKKLRTRLSQVSTGRTAFKGYASAGGIWASGR